MQREDTLSIKIPLSTYGGKILCSEGNFMSNFSYPENYIKYLGTGGARFCMVRQMRWTGGIWFSYGGIRGVIDPGPGSLYHMCSASPALDPHEIRAVLLTHRHLDHSTDINVITEAMTGGGFEKNGVIILPNDAVNSADPVLLHYCADKPAHVYVSEDGKIFDIGMGVTAEAVLHIHHGVDCFGFIFRKEGLPTWGVISDTKLLDTFPNRYRECVYISINVTFPDKKPRLQHMSVEELKELLEMMHPNLVTISHMGVHMIENGPENFAAETSTPRTRVVAGRDGMVINLDSLEIFSPAPKEPEESVYEAIK